MISSAHGGQGDGHRRRLLPRAGSRRVGPVVSRDVRDRAAAGHLAAVGRATIFAPFAEETDYFGTAEQQFMVNFRVDDLDAMIAALGEAGIAV